MKVDKLIIVMGGDRTGNYETIAPMVNEITTNFNCDVFTIVQSSILRKQILSSSVLSKVFCKNKCIAINRGVNGIFKNLLNAIYLFFQIIKYDNVYLITNRKDYSYKFYIFYKTLDLFSAKKIYTKSYSRSALTHKRQFRKNPTNKDELLDYALIPTAKHADEYNAIGYKKDQLVVTGYPKFYPSWRDFIANIAISRSLKKIDVLFVFTKEYSNLEKVIFEVLTTIIIQNNFNKIVLKPHPTTPVENLYKILEKINIPKGKSIVVSTDNVAFLSFKAKVVISHATSAAYDAKIFNKHLINYYSDAKVFVDKYRNHEMNEMDNHEIMSSANACDFISNDICYGFMELREALEHISSDKLINDDITINKSVSNSSKSLLKIFS